MFWSAFRQSRNAMVLVDEQRVIVEVNGAFIKLLGHARQAVLGRPAYNLRVERAGVSEREWRTELRKQQFTGVGDFRCADGRALRLEFAGHPEIVTGRQLSLVVILHTGRRVSPHVTSEAQTGRAELLSPRETEVVRLIALGLSGPEIAGELHLTHNTVRTHIRNAMTKRGARSRAQLVAMALAEAPRFSGGDPPPGLPDDREVDPTQLGLGDEPLRSDKLSPRVEAGVRPG